MNVPFVDLRAQYESIKGEIDATIHNVLDNTAFIGGREHSELRKEFAAYCDTSACALVGNGTDAIYLALRALGIGAGDEVITVSHTFIGTVEPITMAGATPVFVDVHEDLMVINEDLIEAAITPRTKAIIPVHLYGQPCNMDKIIEIATRRDLRVIEDAAQAHGARWNGQRVGSIGDLGCFSFYPGKNLGAYGDGGAVVGADDELVERVQMLANHGRKDKYLHQIEGVNSRLDGLQAAVLRVKLRHLDSWNELRAKNAAEYSARLAGQPHLTPPRLHELGDSVWHLFVVKTEDRDGLSATLKSNGVSSGIHYPVPLHQQPAYEYLRLPESSLPVTEKIAKEILSLPMFPELTPEVISQVVETAAEHFSVAS